MAESPSERRLSENEVVFRKLNREFLKGIDDTNQMAIEDNQPEYLILSHPDSFELLFFCECSDEKCTMRVKLSLHDYKELHLANNHFVLVPGHEVPSIEHIISRHKPEYIVVEKFVQPPTDSERLHPTTLDNG